MVHYAIGAAFSIGIIWLTLGELPASQPKGWLAILNASILQIALCRAYRWSLAKLIGLRITGKLLTGLDDAKLWIRLLFDPIIQLQRMSMMIISFFCGLLGLIISQNYHQLLQPRIEMGMLDCYGLIATTFCCFLSLIFYMRELKRGNTVMKEVLERWKHELVMEDEGR